MTQDERQFIQIEADEDANSVKDRLSFYRGERVLLVWPEEGTALTRKLDLVLIQREAIRRQIKLAFVTHDPQVIQHARDLNISTFQTIGASERGRWKRGRTRVFTGRERRPTIGHEGDTLEDITAAYRQSLFTNNLTLGGIILRMMVLGIVLGVAFGVFYFVVPQATIHLMPAVQSLDISVEITVNPEEGYSNVDIENAILPALRISVEIEETATIPTTGQQIAGQSDAKGEVLFINQTDEEVILPAGVVVSTSASTPVNFRTTEDAVVPAGVGAEIMLEVEPLPNSLGEIGNVEANMVNTVIGFFGEQVTVINPQPISGGGTQIRQVVTQDDRDRLNTQVNQLLQQRAYNEIIKLPQIGESQRIILETLRIVEERDEWTRFSALPGAYQDTLSLIKRAVVEVIVVDTTLGQQIVFARMASQIPRGRAFDPDSITYTLGDVSIVDGIIQFNMAGSGLVVGQINEPQIKSAIANLTVNQAQAYLKENLALQPDAPLDIIITPPLFGRIPIWTERITIEVQTP